MDLGEQKVTLALLRETRYLICLYVQRKITALILNFLPNSHSGLGSSPFYYDDWLSLDLKNVSEEILWLHSVEVCIQLPLFPSLRENMWGIYLIQQSILNAGVLWSCEAAVQEYAS